MIARGCLCIVAASVWVAFLVMGQLGSAEQVSRADAQIEARELERFLRANHFQAVARSGKGFAVEIDSGIVTIKLSNDPQICREGASITNVSTVVDIRSLAESGEDTRRSGKIASASFLFRKDATRTLRSAYEAHDDLIAEARSQYGWGETAAVAAANTFTERYGKALALYHVESTYCSGDRGVRIPDPNQWTVTFWPTADPSEFVELLRRYQASLPEEADL
jgi:hypothetical protein